MPKPLFLPGNPGGPGRRKGSRNALAESFLGALHKDFLVHGAEAIEAARAESPLGYCRVVASLLPAKLEIASGGGSVSDDDLLAIIRGAADRDDGQAGSDVVEGSVH
jgi:hypothetical protein